MRWALKLQDYDFEIEYIKEDDNIADGLSRFTKEATISVETISKQNISKEDRRLLISEYHRASGHGSSNTVKFLMQNKFVWNNIFKEIEDFVANCKICEKAGLEKRNTMNRVVEVEESNELWQCDLIGRVEAKDKSNKFILVCVDHFTKWVDARVIKYKSAEEIIKAMTDIIKKAPNKPKKIISDNGREFQNRQLQTVMARLGVVWDFASPYHHKSMGLVERANQTLWNKIRLLSQFGKLSWERATAEAVKAMNISFNRAIGTSPYIAVFGEEPTLQIDAKFTHKVPKPILISKIHNEIKQYRVGYYKSIQKGVTKVVRDIIAGTKVLIFNQPPRKPLEPQWISGFTVVRPIGRDAYEVTDGQRIYRLNKIHVKRASLS